jgi:hypothetical protein
VGIDGPEVVELPLESVGVASTALVAAMSVEGVSEPGCEGLLVVEPTSGWVAFERKELPWYIDIWESWPSVERPVVNEQLVDVFVTLPEVIVDVTFWEDCDLGCEVELKLVVFITDSLEDRLGEAIRLSCAPDGDVGVKLAVLATDSLAFTLVEVFRLDCVEGRDPGAELEFAVLELLPVTSADRDIDVECEVALVVAAVDLMDALEFVEWVIVLLECNEVLVECNVVMVECDVVLVECAVVLDKWDVEVEVDAPGVRYQFFGGSFKHSPTVTPFHPLVLMRL